MALGRAFCSPLPTRDRQMSCPACLPVVICFLSHVGTGGSWPMEPMGVLRGCPGIVTGPWGQEQLPAVESPTLQPLSCRTRTLTQLPPCSKCTIQLRFPALCNFTFLCITHSSSHPDQRWDFRKKECFLSWRESSQLLPQSSGLRWLGPVGRVNRGPISSGLLQSWFVNAWERPCWILIVCGSQHMISSVWSQQCSFSALLIFDGCCAWLHWCGSWHSRQWFPIRCFVSTTEVWSPYMMANIY